MVKVNFDLNGVKIPKKVAGVKVPKKLRKTGKKLIAKANSPQGREVITAGLAIVGTALAAKAQVRAARASERAATEGEQVATRAAAVGERARSKVVRHPSAPGEPGIDPAHDLGEAIAAGIGALQQFLGNVRKP